MAKTRYGDSVYNIMAKTRYDDSVCYVQHNELDVIVLAHSDTLSWVWANNSLILLLNA